MSCRVNGHDMFILALLFGRGEVLDFLCVMGIVLPKFSTFLLKVFFGRDEDRDG